MIRFGSVVFEEIGNGGHKYVSHRPPPISELQSMQMEIKRISKTSPPPKKTMKTTPVRSNQEQLSSTIWKKKIIFTLSQGATAPWGTVFFLNAEVP